MTAVKIRQDACAGLETEAAVAAMPSVDELIRQLYADMNTELPSWIGDKDKGKKKENNAVTAPTGEGTETSQTPRRVSATCVSSTVTGETFEEPPTAEALSEKEKASLQALVTIFIASAVTS